MPFCDEWESIQRIMFCRKSLDNWIATVLIHSNMSQEEKNTTHLSFYPLTPPRLPEINHSFLYFSHL